MMIPSVEPISERSFGCGVEVGCVKNAVEPNVPSRAGGVENVRAALKSAIRNPSPMVMMGRTSEAALWFSFFICVRELMFRMSLT